MLAYSAETPGIDVVVCLLDEIEIRLGQGAVGVEIRANPPFFPRTRSSHRLRRQLLSSSETFVSAGDDNFR